MAMYVGKLVELRTNKGTYRGTVEEAGQGKVMLVEVQFIDENGKMSILPRIRIGRNDLVDRSIQILDGEASAVSDPISMYNQAEQRLGAMPGPGAGRSRRSAPFSSGMRSRSQVRAPVPAEDWTMEPNHVFPLDDVFALEREKHETQLVRVNSVREMRDYFNYCVLNDPNDREFSEALDFVTSRTIARVGLSVFGSPLSRTTRPSWIAVATPRGVFLFDVRFFNKSTFASCRLAEFLAQPPNILPKKIMHDSRCAADSLKHCFGVNLSIYCDTLAMKTSIFIRDSVGKVPRNVWSLFDLLIEYIPNGKDIDLLEHRYDFAQFECDVWNARPVKESVLHLAAALTVHLCDLFDRLMAALMDPVIYASGIMLDCFRKADSAPFTTREALLRMPDGIAELAGSATANVGSQYVWNAVGPSSRRLPPHVVYQKGLVRCGMGAFIASTSSNGRYEEV